MKVDAHQHHWRFDAEAFPWISPAMSAIARDCLPSDVRRKMREQGVQASVLVQARAVEAETDFLLAQAERYSQVAGVVGWTDLASPKLQARLDQWGQSPKLRGFRHLLQDEISVSGWVQRSDIRQGVRQLQARKLVYEVLVFDHQLHETLPFCSEMDQHWLVLDHIGKPCIRNWWTHSESAQRWGQALRAVAALPHVMCKLSGLVTEADWMAAQRRGGLTAEDLQAIEVCLDLALEAFGPARMMFGSDWPVCELAATYDDVHCIVQSWANTRLSADEQALLWSKSAQRCYGLTLPGDAITGSPAQH